MERFIRLSLALVAVGCIFGLKAYTAEAMAAIVDVWAVADMAIRCYMEEKCNN